MARLLLSLLFFSNINCFGAKPIDSLNYRITQIETIHKNNFSALKRSNDSLQRELLIYKVKDSFYSDAFSSQGTLYSALMGIISSLIVAIGVGFLATRVNTLQNKMQSQIDKLNEDTALLYGSNKINFATSLIGLGRHAHTESMKGYYEDRYASSLVSGFQAIYQYCSAFSLNTEAMSQGQLNDLVKDVIGLCGGSIEMLRVSLESLDRDTEQVYVYKDEFKNIINDTDLDELVSRSVTGSLHSNYYNLKTSIANLINRIGK